MKIVFGFLTAYLWIGIIFAIFLLLWLRSTSNKKDYQDIYNHPALLVLKWPMLLVRTILIFQAYKKIQCYIKNTEDRMEEVLENQKSEYKETITDKSKNINERLDALEKLGEIDYYFE